MFNSPFIQVRMEGATPEVVEYFEPSCTGRTLPSFQKSATVDLSGKLTTVEEPRSVTSAGNTELVANARIVFMDKVAVPISFWGESARTAKQLEGKVITIFSGYVSAANQEKKAVTFRSRGSGKIVLAQKQVQQACQSLGEGDVLRDAIGSFERSSKPVSTESLQAFRSSIDSLRDCSEKELARLSENENPDATVEVVWEVKGVVIQVDSNKLFNNDQELWVRLTITDHTGTVQMQATEGALASLVKAKTIKEVEERAKARELVTQPLIDLTVCL